HKVENTWSTNVLDSTAGNKRQFPYISSATESVYEVGGASNGNLITQTTTTSTVDNYANVTQAVSAVTDKDAASPFYTSVWTSTLNRTMSIDTSNWCVSLPTQTTIQKALPDTTSQ